MVALQEAEDWLYSEEGEDATKSVYVAQLDGLKVLATRSRSAFRAATRSTRTSTRRTDRPS